MAGNVIYRGPITDEPETINLPVAGAYLPGILVVASAAALTQAVAANADDQLYILSNNRFVGQDVITAYASGDTAVAYETAPGQKYQAQMAAGTYALGDRLTVDANGRLAAATGIAATTTVAAANIVVAYCSQAGTFSAGDLADVTIANRVIAL